MDKGGTGRFLAVPLLSCFLRGSQWLSEGEVRCGHLGRGLRKCRAIL